MINWEKDWNNPEDAVYDGPDGEQLAAAAKRKAMREYMDWSMEIEDAIIKSIGQEEYDAREHWINNPLIKPQSKVYLFEQWEERIRKEQNERIIKLIEGFTCGKHPIPEFCKWAGIDDQCNTAQELIELIKGETKPFLTAPQVEQMVDEMLEE
jgi:hypothetical protein